MQTKVLGLLFIAAMGTLMLSPGHSFGNPRNLEDPGFMNEFSSNFDLSDIQPVMQLFSQRITSGFSKSEAEKVVALADRLKVGEEGDLDFEVSFNGKNGKLRIRIVMDDVESPDAYFFTNIPELMETIRVTIVTYMEKSGRL